MGKNEEQAFDYRRGWHIEPELGATSPARKTAYEDFGTAPIDARRYYAPEFKQLEDEKLWPRVWTMAGVAADIPNTGDCFRYELGRESLIIVRQADQTIRAYYNVCPHRGNALLREDFAHVSKLVCSFHGWQFALDGRNLKVTDREMFRPEALDGPIGLTPVRCEQAFGLVFINMDANAEPLADFLGEVVAHLAPYRIEDMRVVRDASTEWNANWKTTLDAFNEAYHAFFVHAMARKSFDDVHTQIDTYANGMNRRIGMIGHPSPRLPDQGLNDDLRYLLIEAGLDPAGFDPAQGDVRAAIQRAKRARAEARGLDWSGFTDGQLTDDWNYSFFPNFTLNIHVEGLLLQRFRPHPTDPEKCYYDNMVLVHPTDDAASIPAYMGIAPGTDVSGRTRPARLQVPNGEPGMGPVVDEDGVLVPVVQRGLRSRGFRGLRLGEPEHCIRQFHHELDRRLYGGSKPAGAL